MEPYVADLSTEERILLNSEIEKNSKNSTIAWILWWFLGTIGGHRYYMNKQGSAIIMTILSFTVVGLIVSAPWALIDAFRLGGWLKEDKRKVENQAIQSILLYKNKS